LEKKIEEKKYKKWKIVQGVQHLIKGILERQNRKNRREEIIKLSQGLGLA
jgi:hypothetical protein